MLSDEGQGMSDKVKECINRYKDNIENIISKYMNVNDSKDFIVSFKKCRRQRKEEEKTNNLDVQNESISFIRYMKRIKQKPFITISFLEIYIGLCCTVEFDDIFELLSR